LHAYFRQRFAQVTNPAIDSLRERKVMALDSFIGRRGNLLAESPDQARLLQLSSIAIDDPTLVRSQNLKDDGLAAVTISTLFEVPREKTEVASGNSLSAALDRILFEARDAVREGAGILILSDRGVDERHAAVPALLATAAVHHALIRADLRNLADIIVESGEVCDVHALACLIGYGASAVNPYLALAAAASLSGSRNYEELSPEDLQRNYLQSIEKGFLKIASKMGISTAMGIPGCANLRDARLSADLVDRHFTGTPARLSGIGLPEIEIDILCRHREAFSEPSA
jgi:hypothetical protein